MNDAAAAEMLGVALGIGHVVSMGQEDVTDAAKRFQLPHERRDKLRRVDQPVARGVAKEVAVAAIGLGRVVAAIEDRLLDREWEVLLHRLDVIVAETADRPGW